MITFSMLLATLDIIDVHLAILDLLLLQDLVAVLTLEDLDIAIGSLTSSVLVMACLLSRGAQGSIGR